VAVTTGTKASHRPDLRQRARTSQRCSTTRRNANHPKAQQHEPGGRGNAHCPQHTTGEVLPRPDDATAWSARLDAVKATVAAQATLLAQLATMVRHSDSRP
jgi:hypothetical protein